MKVGKVVAVSVGGSIILLQIAANEGYIQIDWNKITKRANKLADKAEEAITGEGPSWADKVSNRFSQITSIQSRFDLKFSVNPVNQWHSIPDQIIYERKFLRGNILRGRFSYRNFFFLNNPCNMRIAKGHLWFTYFCFFFVSLYFPLKKLEKHLRTNKFNM